jgi:predicted nucleic acid-binding protein
MRYTRGDEPSVKAFVDTNVLVCARDFSDPDKQRRAQAWMSKLWELKAGCTSVQVLNEFYVTVTRKLRPAMQVSDARADVADLGEWNPVTLSDELLNQAWAIEDRFGLSFWDSMVVSAAQSARCRLLLTEDLQDGLEIDGLTVIDPFAHHPHELL